MSTAQGHLFEAVPAPSRFAGRATRDVTFKGKLGLPVHRWYRLTASFSPMLADDIADEFGLGPGDLALDPFGGVGTVPLCLIRRGIPAVAVEFNPYLHFVSTVKCRSRPNVEQVAIRFDDFLDALETAARCLPVDEPGCRRWLADHARWVPPIHRPERWWSPANLAQLTLMRRLVHGRDERDDAGDLIRLAVLAVLIPVSNAKHNHVSLTFADHPLPRVDVVNILRRKLQEIAEDLPSLPADRHARIFHGNSKFLTDVLPPDVRPSAVITSPPYPNRFSYARETRPHLFFFDFIESANSVGQLETDAIGGTWGRATSVLSKGVQPANDLVASLLAPYVGAIDDRGDLMAAYVTKYFNDLYAHAEQVARVCRPDSRLAYVIGNSKFYGQPLPSDELLAGIFAHHGFQLDRIEKMRRRQSKTGLYEAVVFMSRND